MDYSADNEGTFGTLTIIDDHLYEENINADTEKMYVVAAAVVNLCRNFEIPDRIR